ncbi:MAG: PAS domain-containing protein [Rhodospirillales bacterium]|nr:PAS domain-containing protein [Rhodospirillales bacterium]
MTHDAGPQPFDASPIRSERILRALAYWEAKRGRRRVPDRADFDPIDIAEIMPHVVMWDVLPQGYRCRLAGTKMVEIHGREMTGIDMAEFHGAHNAVIQPEYDGVVRAGVPHYVERSLFWMHRDYRSYARILLPFSNGGPEVRIILNVSHFDAT